MLGNLVVAGIISAVSVPDARVRLHRDDHLSQTQGLEFRSGFKV
jgi:hypothetical protein